MALLPVLASAAGTAGGNLMLPVVDGLEQSLARMLRFTVKLAERTHRRDQEAEAEMLDLMRARVPTDTGRLLNGIGSSQDGNLITVFAHAHREARSGKLQEDYARYVEFGTKPGERGRRVSYAADTGFFASDTFPEAGFRGRATGRTRKVYRTHPGTRAQPFFFNSAREVLERRNIDAGNIPADAAAEEQLAA